MEPNPFKPGAGRIPPELAGREDLIDRFRSVLREARDTGEYARPWIIHGLRGVGKTVLLTQFAREATELKLVVVKVEASSGVPLTVALAKQLNLALRKVMSAGGRTKQVWEQAARALKSFQIRVDPAGNTSIGMSIEPALGIADSGDLAVDLQELLAEIGSAAREASTAVLVAVDELQTAHERELRALNTALHGIGQGVMPVPVVFVGAGLPTLRAVLAEANTYAERLYDYRSIGLLTQAEVEAALTRPIRNVSWERDALDAVTLETGGYPYAAQTYGYHVVEAQADPNRIVLGDVDLGSAAARDEMDRTVYGARWDRITDAQRSYLRAMAADEGLPSTVAAIAQRLGRKVSSLSSIRDDLIRGGFIYAPARGVVAFTVPGMDRFIRRQD